MPGPQPSRTPSRASSSNSLRAGGGVGAHGGQPTAAQLEALVGASRAFNRPQPTARSPSSLNAAAYGAVAASTIAKNKTPSPRAADNAGSRVSPAGAGAWSSATENFSSTKDAPVLDHKNMPTLRPTLQLDKTQTQRDIQVGPTMASGRSSSQQDTPTRPRTKTTHEPETAPKPRPLSVQSPGEATAGPDRPTDTSPIAPTTSLVALFERTAGASTITGKRPDPIVIKPSSELAMQSPKPMRTADGGITQLFKMQLDGKHNITNSRARDEEVAAFAPRPQVNTRSISSDEAYTSASEHPQASRSPITIPGRLAGADQSSSPVAATSPSSIAERLHPPLPPRRSSGTASVQSSRAAASSPNQLLSVSSHSTQSIPARYNQLYPRRVTPLNTGDDLANAIVASSLASTRAPSPRKVEPPPPPSRRNKGNKLSFSRTPSPAKQGMLTTLRTIDSSESEGEEVNHPYGKHKKKRLVRKHPNKHHEGDRKRWRDAVTERERKRYEGVWAANKGLYISFTLEEEDRFRRAPNSNSTLTEKVTVHECVSNIVTKDVWSRSRLPEPTLETVWDLVDNDCIGRLSKVEFVVGLWLIDQRLKGRKLPVKVSDSVWASVKTLQGIRIKRRG